MSQNKTVIPGLDQPQGPYQGGSAAYAMPNGNQMPPQPNPYQRQHGAKSTIVPGVNPRAHGLASGGTEPAPEPQQRVVASSKPVVGFLYSISRTAAGEYWPLHIGQNTIGQGPENDIQLAEGTVSKDHAVLMVRKMKNPDTVIASLTDSRSTNGSMLNGKSLAFADVECKNGDIITIGDNYEFFLVLIDPATIGLKVSESFIPIELEEEDDMPDAPSTFLQDAHQRPTRQGNLLETMPYEAGYVPTNGTVGLDGSTAGFGAKGGTVAY